MAKIVQKISLEVAKPNFLQAIIAKQFDSDSRYLKVTLVNGSEKIEVQESSTVTINARRVDGAEDAFKGEVNEDGTVTVPLTYWMLELEGRLECDISVIDTDNTKLSTTKFTVEVERASCTGEGTDSADKYDIIILQGKDIVSSVNGKKGEVHLLASDVGAAPAGYGLGEGGKAFFPTSEAELNNMLDEIISTMPHGATGFYRIYDNSAAVWGGNCMFTTISKFDNTYATADFRSYAFTTSRLFKTRNAAGWHSLEWLNPPMEVGKEYKTAEKWQGKSVYVRAYDLGVCDDGTKIEHGIPSSCQKVRFFSGMLPFFCETDKKPGGSQYDCWVSIDNSYIEVHRTGEVAEQCYVTIFYTK